MSELLSRDENKWVMIIAKETYVSLLLVNEILNNIASHIDPFNWNSLQCYSYWQMQPKKKENDRTWVIPGHWMGKWWDWNRNFDYMSYSVCKLSKFKASEDLKWILWYFQLWKAWTATCWSAELDWIFSCFYPEFTSRYFLEIQNSCHTITCLSSF